MALLKMSPVLKWAGGKTQLIEQIKSKMPTSFDRYYEPFVGGASVVLSVSPPKAFINDSNEQLINLYQQIKENPYSLIEHVNKLDNITCDKDLYYSIRQKYNDRILSGLLDVETASLMIWINKHCFNGLYRVNNKGLFNVPYNNKTGGASIDENNILAISEYFQKSNITISCSDFEAACKYVRSGDFVYFDSPYIPVSHTADFTDYTKDGFSYSDHERLANLFKRLDKAGAKVMLSNNDVSLVYDLYRGYRIESVQVKRMINSVATKRTSREVIVTNY